MNNINTMSTNNITMQNKVLSNTYKLLGLNIASASFISFLAMSFNVPVINWMIVLALHMVLLFVVEKNANNSFGVFATFLFTGWLGFTSGPIISLYLSLPNGTDIVTQALSGTAAIFIGLSAWVHFKKTDVQHWGSFLGIAVLSAFGLGVLNMLVFNSGIFSILISTVFMFLSGAIIVWQTSSIIHGGETNYVRATTTLFVSIYNLFMSLLSILGISSGD